MIVGNLKRRLEISDQMEDEVERGEPFFGIGVRVCRLDRELLDLIDDASLRRTIRCERAGWKRRVP